MIGGGTVLMVYTVGLAEGTYADMIDLATRSSTGHLQLLAEGYNEKPSLYKTVKDPQAKIETLLATPGIQSATARVETSGLVSFGRRTTGVGLWGIDPDGERAVSGIPGALKEGEFLKKLPPSDPLPIVVGSGVAKRLNARLGDEISFVGQAADGSIAAELFRITGIIETGVAEADRALAAIRLEDAQELLILPNRAHRIAAAVKDLSRVQEIAHSVSTVEGEHVQPWQELMPELHSSIEADRSGQYIFLVLIVAVVALGVMNTMAMSVVERHREFGVLLALGTTPGQLTSMTIWEGIWLALFGVGLGVAVGAILNVFLAFPYPGGAVEFGGVVIEMMNPANSLRGNLWFPLAIFTTTVATSLIPALRTARLIPAEALRTLG
jgi:ABC-type lipoprotein release transport system permease subunit